MTRSIKAALLSGLVFPGIGHIVLKQYLRALVFLLVALAALSVIVVKAVKQALAIVDKINSGEISIDSGAIEDMAAMSISGADDSMLTIASLVFVTVWIVGIVDSYRLGANQEK
jgi:hypothetical protein